MRRRKADGDTNCTKSSAAQSGYPGHDAAKTSAAVRQTAWVGAVSRVRDRARHVDVVSCGLAVCQFIQKPRRSVDQRKLANPPRIALRQLCAGLAGFRRHYVPDLL